MNWGFVFRRVIGFWEGGCCSGCGEAECCV